VRVALKRDAGLATPSVSGTDQSNLSVSRDTNSPMMNSSSYHISTGPANGNRPEKFSQLSLATDRNSTSTPDSHRSSFSNSGSQGNNSGSNANGSGTHKDVNSSKLSQFGNSAKMEKVNGFVLGGGLAALGAVRSTANRKKLRRAPRKPRSKDEVHSQLRAIDEQYRCDLSALEAVYAKERKRIMNALRIVQERGL